MFFKINDESFNWYISSTVFKQGGLSHLWDIFAAIKTCVKFCAHFNTGSHVDFDWITYLSIASNRLIYSFNNSVIIFYSLSSKDYSRESID